VLRVATTVLALATIAQPLFIGRYLDGDYDAIRWHSANAFLLVLLTTVVGVVALVWWLRGGRPWPFVLLVLLWFLVGLQLGTGYARSLSIHIPLGVAIVTGTIALAVWSWYGDVFRRRA
jgi:hypothetical protein